MPEPGIGGQSRGAHRMLGNSSLSGRAGRNFLVVGAYAVGVDGHPVGAIEPTRWQSHLNVVQIVGL